LKTGRIIEHWTNTNDLCLKVITAVGNATNVKARPGWIRGDQAIDPKVLQDMERLRIENQELQQKLAATNEIEIRFDPRFVGPDDTVSVDYEITPTTQPKTTEYKQVKLTLGEIFVGCFEELRAGLDDNDASHALG